MKDVAVPCPVSPHSRPCSWQTWIGALCARARPPESLQALTRGMEVDLGITGLSSGDRSGCRGVCKAQKCGEGNRREQQCRTRDSELGLTGKAGAEGLGQRCQRTRRHLEASSSPCFPAAKELGLIPTGRGVHEDFHQERRGATSCRRAVRGSGESAVWRAAWKRVG